MNGKKISLLTPLIMDDNVEHLAVETHLPGIKVSILADKRFPECLIEIHHGYDTIVALTGKESSYLAFALLEARLVALKQRR